MFPTLTPGGVGNKVQQTIHVIKAFQALEMELGQWVLSFNPWHGFSLWGEEAVQSVAEVQEAFC